MESVFQNSTAIQNAPLNTCTSLPFPKHSKFHMLIYFPFWHWLKSWIQITIDCFEFAAEVQTKNFVSHFDCWLDFSGCNAETIRKINIFEHIVLTILWSTLNEELLLPRKLHNSLRILHVRGFDYLLKHFHLVRFCFAILNYQIGSSDLTTTMCRHWRLIAALLSSQKLQNRPRSNWCDSQIVYDESKRFRNNRAKLNATSTNELKRSL